MWVWIINVLYDTVRWMSVNYQIAFFFKLLLRLPWMKSFVCGWMLIECCKYTNLNVFVVNVFFSDLSQIKIFLQNIWKFPVREIFSHTLSEEHYNPDDKCRVSNWKFQWSWIIWVIILTHRSMIARSHGKKKTWFRRIQIHCTNWNIKELKKAFYYWFSVSKCFDDIINNWN